MVNGMLSPDATKTDRPQSREAAFLAYLGYRVVLTLDAERRKRGPNEARMLAREIATKVRAPVPKVTAALRFSRETGSVRFYPGRSGASGQWALTDAGVGFVAWIREAARCIAAGRPLPKAPEAIR